MDRGSRVLIVNDRENDSISGSKRGIFGRESFPPFRQNRQHRAIIGRARVRVGESEDVNEDVKRKCRRNERGNSNSESARA